MISSYDTFIGITPNEIREIFGLESIPEYDDIFIERSDNKPTNCKNCGAPLTKSGYCEYCRTQY